MNTRHILILLTLLLLIVATGCQQRSGAGQQKKTNVAKEAPVTGPEKGTVGTSAGTSADEKAVNDALAAIGGADSYFDDPALSTFDEDLVGF